MSITLTNGTTTHEHDKEVDWCATLVTKLTDKMRDEGWSCHVFWDDEGEPEVLCYWPGSGDHHCRFIIFADETGKHCGFISIGAQGVGGIQSMLNGDSQHWASTASVDFFYYRRIIEHARRALAGDK